MQIYIESQECFYFYFSNSSHFPGAIRKISSPSSARSISSPIRVDQDVTTAFALFGFEKTSAETMTIEEGDHLIVQEMDNGDGWTRAKKWGILIWKIGDRKNKNFWLENLKKVQFLIISFRIFFVKKNYFLIFLTKKEQKEKTFQFINKKSIFKKIPKFFSINFFINFSGKPKNFFFQFYKFQKKKCFLMF